MNVKVSLKAIFLFCALLGAFIAISQNVSAATGDWKGNPFEIRGFVNSQYGYEVVPTSYNGSGALAFDQATALKICQLAGFDKVVNKNCTATFYEGRCNYSSCGDNVLVRWNGSSWSRSNACSGQWLATLKCGNSAPTCTPNASKQCVGNSVYYFDSCNHQGSLFQTCSANQICQNGQCINQTPTA